MKIENIIKEVKSSLFGLLIAAIGSFFFYTERISETYLGLFLLVSVLLFLNKDDLFIRLFDAVLGRTFKDKDK